MPPWAAWAAPVPQKPSAPPVEGMARKAKAARVPARSVSPARGRRPGTSAPRNPSSAGGAGSSPPTAEITTLQLARRIADAVFLALHPAGLGPNRSDRDALDPPTQAVLRALRESGSWFCRWTDRDDGSTDDQPFEQVPLPLDPPGK